MVGIKEPKKIYTHRELIGMITNPSFPLVDRALVVTLYLTNSRVSEIVKVLRRESITHKILFNQKFIEFVNLPTEKNKHHPPRNILVHSNREKEFLDVLFLYVYTLKDNDILFNFSRRTALTKVKKVTGYNPHHLRHLRLTHLETDYGLPTEALVKMAGWSDSRPASIYIHLNNRDIAKFMCN